MNGPLLDEMLECRRRRRPYCLVTLAATTGSVPRRAGSRMIIYPDASTSGTIGGGKFESLVIADALALPHRSLPILKTYPLHEASPDSFGAICGGTVTVLIEPQLPPPALTLVGAGHCSRALASLATTCGWHVTVLDDRDAELSGFPAHAALTSPAPEWIAAHSWQEDDALVLVSRNYQLDRDALAAVLSLTQKPGYLGMIGSQRKVRRVLDELLAAGHPRSAFTNLRAPLGLDLGADHPTEIAVSIFAEILTVINCTSGQPLSLDFSALPPTSSAPS